MTIQRFEGGLAQGTLSEGPGIRAILWDNASGIYAIVLLSDKPENFDISYNLP
jgi:hypothetical protein